ncbi:Nif11-like leader peptide family natural product precursor [Roseofilum capinflatum]|uniref:Nif11-like leader peptide family natural product n=1 Tax=Roseofilum capinflatum BLCC-M114 TaxID=3022440 RepID=A0ABT7B6N4_9CYAN|nr:Nif11-like leader peptide family natural product precursor [Roseofilum capinflatum]MDJ1174289.1 Nif11-like leader peptide family natural product precursor [Roseofilum capinflatum BLCC-M114]
MSNKDGLKFYQAILETEELQTKISAMTNPQEIVHLGKQYGYCFTLEDIDRASNDLIKENGKEKQEIPFALSNSFEDRGDFRDFQLYHYEFELSKLQGFDEVVSDLEHLKIKPPTVDIDLYEKSFRQEDFNFASVSPVSPEFQGQYHEITNSVLTGNNLSDEPEYTQRHFHLINLDLHINHPLYDDYLTAKVRLIKRLNNIFGSPVRFSGSLWYPPNGYRIWHTNENQPGWRMYIIDFDYFSKDKKSFFRYLNPENKELVTLYEKPKTVRFFKIEQKPEKLFWHCIVNPTQLNRWSFGFVVPDNWMERLSIS